MTLNRKAVEKNEAKSDIPRIEEGTYMARIVSVVDLGTQQVPKFNEEGYNHKMQVHITWEFPNELIEINGEQKPRWYGKTYTVSFHEMSALWGLLSNLQMTRIENLSELINTPSMVTIGSTKNGNPKIINVVGVPKGVEVGEIVNPTVFFDFDNPSKDQFDKLPQFLQKQIQESLDYPESFAQSVIEGNVKNEEASDDLPFDDEIPFE